MKTVRKSVLIWYSPREMYDLVTGVADYPKFLPWCSQAEILASSDDSMTARLHLHYAGLRHNFTTENTHVPDEMVTVKLVDGPFSMLEGHWKFLPLGREPGACKIEFELCYAFSSHALQTLVSPVFDKIANTFVDAFVKRAEEVYGKR